MLSLFDMNARLGFGPGYGLLWTASISDVLGVPPADRRGHEFVWTEEQFQEILRRLIARCGTVLQQSIEDEL